MNTIFALLSQIRIALIGLFLISALQNQAQSQSLEVPVAEQKSPVEIRFQDFFKLPIGPKGVDFSSKAITLIGQYVAVTGYMVKSDAAHEGQFFLTPNPLEINELDDGPANDLPVNAVLVKLDKSQSKLQIAQEDGLVRVQGQLELGRQENESGEVTWIRVIVSPHSVKIINKSEHHSPI